MAMGGEQWPTVEAVQAVSLFHESCALSKLGTSGLDTISKNTLKVGDFVSCLAALKEHA